MSMNTNEELDTLVRDLTQVGSISKSEARRRIEEYAEGRAEEIIACRNINTHAHDKCKV